MQTIEANGAKIPVVGLGTWQLNGDVGSRITEQALKLGYRHLDCALIYGNEKEVGEGLHASGVKREDVFVTTKVPHTELAPANLERAVKQSLSNLRALGREPAADPLAEPGDPARRDDGRDVRDEEEGLARHIGISNFTVELIEEAVKLSSEPIATNQIEWHPYLDEEKVRAACKKHGIAVTAYCPIARGRAVGDEVLGRDRQETRQERGAGVAALAGAEGRDRDPAHLEGRAAVREHGDLRLRTVRRTTWPRSMRWQSPPAASSASAGRRSGIESEALFRPAG